LAENCGSVILVDDEEHIRVSARQALELAGFEVACFDQAGPVAEQVAADFDGIVVSDIRMPDMDGIALMRRLRQRDPDLPVILITGHGDVAMAVQAMRDGAYDFIEKPFASDRLVEAVQRAIERRRLSLEITALRREVATQSSPGLRLVGDSPAIHAMRRRVAQIAETDADVLIHGETGAGKEVVARTIHELSARRQGRFVAVNCGAIPENLIESELFGHEPGAFTGARERRIGRFEYASGGTLFLDELESMHPLQQVSLLRVLQDRTVQRLGSNKSVPLNLRIIAASKADLRKAADEGKFREDLYYRLNVAQVDIPPLRDRRADIPLLFRHFVLVTCARYGREAPDAPSDMLARLSSQDWPGNVRELATAAERFVLFGDEAVTEPAVDGKDAGRSLREQVETFEKSLIAQELARTRGSVVRVSEKLQIPRKTLYDKLSKYGLSRDDFL
jgi:two-component system C4-dicarboxylate transport response regulator DctD